MSVRTNKLIVSCGGKSIDFYNDPSVMLSTCEGVGKEITVNTTEYSRMDGGCYNGSHVPVRTISIAARFRPGDMARQKKRVYDVFKAGRELTVKYVTPQYNVTITGYCERLDIPPNNDPLVISASIICPDPYFRQAVTEPVQLFGVPPTFYFLESGITLNRVIFGNTEKITIVTLDYDGDTDTGFVIKINLIDDCTHFRIDNFTTGKVIEMTGDFKGGDVIEISTEDGNKYAHLIRDGTVSNALKYLSADSSFWSLQIGENVMKFTADELEDAGANVYLYYDVKVGGV